MSKQERPTKAQCILSFCHRCQDYYSKGKTDCGKTDCELYVYMPYRLKDSEPDYSWQEWNPKRIGFVKPEESKRGVKLTEDQLTSIARRLSDYLELQTLKTEQAVDMADDGLPDMAEAILRSEDSEDTDWDEELGEDIIEGEFTDDDGEW